MQLTVMTPKPIHPSLLPAPSYPDDSLLAWLSSPLVSFSSWAKRELHFKDSTLAVYGAMLRRFVAWLGDRNKDLGNCGEADILEFLDSPPKLERQHRQRYVRFLRDVFDHLGELGLPHINPARMLVMKPDTVNGRNDTRFFLSPDKCAAVIRLVEERIENQNIKKASVQHPGSPSSAPIKGSTEKQDDQARGAGHRESSGDGGHDQSGAEQPQGSADKERHSDSASSAPIKGSIEKQDEPERGPVHRESSGAGGHGQAGAEQPTGSADRERHSDSASGAPNRERTDRNNSQKSVLENRDAVIVALVLGCGLRVSCLGNITVNCIDFERGVLNVPNLRNTPHSAPILPFALAVLANLVQGRSGRDNLLPPLKQATAFRSVSNFLVDAGAMGADETRLGPQTLRNTYAAVLIEGKAKAADIRLALGLATMESAHNVMLEYSAVRRGKEVKRRPSQASRKGRRIKREKNEEVATG